MKPITHLSQIERAISKLERSYARYQEKYAACTDEDFEAFVVDFTRFTGIEATQYKRLARAFVKLAKGPADARIERIYQKLVRHVPDLKENSEIPSSGQLGLSNAGNNCAINSVMQVVTHIPLLSQHVREAHGADSRLTEFLDTYEKDRATPGQRVSSADSQKVRQSLHQLNPRIQASSAVQEDSSECLGALLNRDSSLTDQIDTPVRFQFTGEALRGEKGNRILLDLRESRTADFTTRLDQNYFKVRHIFKDKKERAAFNCKHPGASGIKDLYETRQYKEIPQLIRGENKRFQVDDHGRRLGKDLTLVDMPLKFKLAKEHIENGKEDVSYECVAFIVHEGKNPHWGHYVSYIKEGGEWYLKSDRSVQKISEEEAAQAIKTCYQWFYQRA